MRQDLGSKREVSAHSDGDMAPLFLQDVEVVMIDQRPILGPTNDQLAPAAVLDLPYRCWRPGL